MLIYKIILSSKRYSHDNVHYYGTHYLDAILAFTGYA